MNRYIFTLVMAVILWPSSLFADGKDEAPKLTNISVAEDSVLTGFSIGDSITFNTNIDSICGGFRERIIENGTKNILYEAFNSVKNEKGEWVLKFYENVVLEKGHTYTLEIEGHDVADSKSKVIGKMSVIYIGNGAKQQDEVDDYEYSNINYLRFSLQDGEELTSLRLNFISIQFSGEVRIDAERSKIIDEDGNQHDFQIIMPIDNLENYWQFNIPLELMVQSTSHLTLRIYATDLAGRAVKGNVKDYVGKGGNNYYELTYKCTFGYPDLSLSPEEGKYLTLKDFAFFNSASGDSIKILNGENEVRLLSSNNEVLASFKAGDMDMSKDSLSFVCSLEQAIDAVGNYTLVIPEGTFALGNKGLGNRETIALYEISSKLQMYGVKSINPDDGSEVQSLSQIVITFDDIALPDYFNQNKITVTDDSDSLITYAKAIIDENREDYNQCIIVLDDNINTPGSYHLNIPEGIFKLGYWGENNSKEMSFDYTVVEPTHHVGDVFVQTFANADNFLKTIKIDFKKYGVVLVDGISNAETIDVVLTDSLNNDHMAHLRLGQFYNQLIVDVDTAESKLSEGVYQLHIPAGKLILDGETYPVELLVEIIFDPLNPTVDAQMPPLAREEKKKVYNLQGQLIREGMIGEVFKGLKGLYIINGKKVLLK